MRHLLLALAVLLLSAVGAAAQTPLDWTDGGAIQLPSQDLDGDTFPAGTVVGCRVRFTGFPASTDILVSGAGGSVVPIARPSVPKAPAGTSAADATGQCSTPLSTEAGATHVLPVSLRPWRGSGRPTLQP